MHYARIIRPSRTYMMAAAAAASNNIYDVHYAATGRNHETLLMCPSFLAAGHRSGELFVREKKNIVANITRELGQMGRK